MSRSEPESEGISACIVVYNEGTRIRSCLQSICDVVDEIVVLHDGPCDDDMLAIAREFTPHVSSTNVRSGSAEFIRPAALRLCTRDWVLVIDADERLSLPLKAGLRTLTQRADADAFAFPWPYVDERGAPVERTSVSRKKFLFRRANMYSLGLPHMTPETYGHCEFAPMPVFHQLADGNHRPSFSILLRKDRRRARAAAARIAGTGPALDSYNASHTDRRAKNSYKIALMRNRPLVALLTVPVYGFLYWYFRQGYFRAGRTGFHDALNLPLYYGWCAWEILQMRRRG